MRLLVVSPVPTDPQNAGNRARVSNLVTALQICGHAVTFAYAPYESADYDAMSARFGDNLHVLRCGSPPFQTTASRLRRKLQRILSLGSAHTWKVDEWFDDQLVSQIEQLHAKEQFDAAIIEYVYMSKIIGALPTSVRTIIDIHDLMANRHKKYVEAGLQPTWFSTSAKEELRALSRADAIIAIQREEAKYLTQQLQKSVYCVSHFGLQITALPDPGGARVVFVGSNNPINVQGLEWFARSVYPKIRQSVPGAELVIAGSAGLCGSWPEGTSVLGTVNSLVDVYATATVVINPVKFGTGIPVKTIESLSFGRPVIATSAGIRGLDSLSNSAVAVADDDEGFAKHVIWLLKNPEARAQMAKLATEASASWKSHQIATLEAALRGA